MSQDSRGSDSTMSLSELICEPNLISTELTIKKIKDYIPLTAYSTHDCGLGAYVMAGCAGLVGSSEHKITCINAETYNKDQKGISWNTFIRNVAYCSGIKNLDHIIVNSLTTELSELTRLVFDKLENNQCTIVTLVPNIHSNYLSHVVLFCNIDGFKCMIDPQLIVNPPPKSAKSAKSAKSVKSVKSAKYAKSVKLSKTNRALWWKGIFSLDPIPSDENGKREFLSKLNWLKGKHIESLYDYLLPYESIIILTSNATCIKTIGDFKTTQDYDIADFQFEALTPPSSSSGGNKSKKIRKIKNIYKRNKSKNNN